MFSKVCQSARCAAFMACLFALPSARGELIVNGSFETPTVPPADYIIYGSGSTAITGWTVVGDSTAVFEGSFVYSGVTHNAQNGNQWLDLTSASNSPLNGVTQDVSTSIGTNYELSFYVGSATDGAILFPATVDLSIDGGPRMSYTNPNEPNDHLDWMQFSVPFTAVNSMTAITFFNGSVATNELSALDNVSLTAVPEPSSFVLVAIAAGGTWWKRRRSRDRLVADVSPVAPLSNSGDSQCPPTLRSVV